MARPRILVVDDEPGMLRTIERILSTRYDVRAVRLPSAGLAAADAGSFDVAILDVRMPEMDGFALMARLGERQPDLDVIMMTGSTDERDARLIRAIREKAFFFLTKPFDREVLLTLVQRCLEARRLSRENRAHLSRLESELRAAQIFQQSLLPARTASLNGFEIEFVYEPCDELGGDFCDYVLREGCPGAILVSDVSGHGASSAMITGMVKQAFHAAVQENYAPASVLTRIADASQLFPDGKYVTAIAVRLEPESPEIEYASGGHPPAFLRKPDRSTVRLDADTYLLGVCEEADYCAECKTVPFGPGDALLAYTDGATEARNLSGEMFNVEGLHTRIKEFAGAPARWPQSLLHQIVGYRRGPAEDDTLLVSIYRV